MLDLYVFFRWCKAIAKDSNDGDDNYIWVFKMYARGTKCWC